MARDRRWLVAPKTGAQLCIDVRTSICVNGAAHNGIIVQTGVHQGGTNGTLYWPVNASGLALATQHQLGPTALPVANIASPGQRSTEDEYRAPIQSSNRVDDISPRTPNPSHQSDLLVRVPMSRSERASGEKSSPKSHQKMFTSIPGHTGDSGQSTTIETTIYRAQTDDYRQIPLQTSRYNEPISSTSVPQPERLPDYEQFRVPATAVDDYRTTQPSTRMVKNIVDQLPMVEQDPEPLGLTKIDRSAQIGSSKLANTSCRCRKSRSMQKKQQTKGRRRPAVESRSGRSVSEERFHLYQTCDAFGNILAQCDPTVNTCIEVEKPFSLRVSEPPQMCSPPSYSSLQLIPDNYCILPLVSQQIDDHDIKSVKAADQCSVAKAEQSNFDSGKFRGSQPEPPVKSSADDRYRPTNLRAICNSMYCEKFSRSTGNPESTSTCLEKFRDPESTNTVSIQSEDPESTNTGSTPSLNHPKDDIQAEQPEVNDRVTSEDVQPPDITDRISNITDRISISMPSDQDQQIKSILTMSARKGKHFKRVHFSGNEVKVTAVGHRLVITDPDID